MLVLRNEPLDTRRRAGSGVPRRVFLLPRLVFYLVVLVLVRSHLKRTHHIGRAVSGSSASSAHRTALAGTAVALYYQARDGPSCSPIAARGPPAGRAGLLLPNRLLPLNVVGRRGRALLPLVLLLAGRRRLLEVGPLAVRGGAFLSERSCQGVRRASVRAQLVSGFLWCESSHCFWESTRRYAAAHLRSL